VRVELTNVLKEGASNIARGRHRLRGFLVVGQITLGLTLLVGAEMLIANFVHLMHRDLGFRPGNLLTFEVGLSEARYNTAGQIRFSDQLVERLRAIPGVTAVAMGGPRPLTGHEMSISFDIEERPAAAPARPHSDMAIVTPGYFDTLGIALRQGRDFTERDDTSAPRVLVVNEAFARRFFPGENAIGKRISPGATNGKEGILMREIVGVVGDAKQVPWTDEPDPIYYFPYKQLSWNVGAIVLRTAIPPQQLEAAARAELTSMDREAPMFNVQTGDELSSSAVAVPRFLTILMGAFAAIALVLTVVGLYGVLSYAVARRRREIGVRIALGAGRNAVLGLVLREAMALVTVGLLLGLAGSLGVSRLVQSLAFGIPAGNPIFLAVACAIMVVTSLLAAYLPARRAASADPMHALRSE
jgi:predicted permease